MQPVNVLPAFVSQDTDLKTKSPTGTSAETNKEADFSSLVEQHLTDENKAVNGKKSAAANHSATATQSKAIAVNGKNDVDEINRRQESDSKESLDVRNTNKEAPVDELLRKEKQSGKDGSLAESEQFISLLFNSDQTLAQAGESTEAGKSTPTAIADQITDASTNNRNVTNRKESSEGEGKVQNDEHEKTVSVSEHKLSAFSKDELLARAELKNSNVLASQSSGQALKDYQFSLQSQQNAIKNQTLTSEQLMNTQLANTELNNKITDLAASVSQASKNKLTEQVDTGLYQLPVEPIGKENSIAGDMSQSTKESVAKDEVNQADNKTSSLTKLQSDIDTELAAETTATKTINSSLEVLNINPNISDTGKLQLNKANSDKVIAERNSQVTASVENISKEQPVATHEKKSVMTSAQLQASQQVQAQQKAQSDSSEQQSFDDAGDEFIDSMLLAEEKPTEQGLKTTSRVIDNIAMRTVSEQQAQTVQAMQTKQSNDAYVDHQVSEVLNHNVASDTAQIQKNNIQLQQETVSIYRKDFAEAVKDKVMITINQKLQQFDITLDPPEFGNMQVRVNLQGDQASVNFVVQNQQAKDALEQNMQKLRDMLSEQGVDVGGANVEQQDQQQNQNEQSLGQNNDNGSTLRNGAQKEEHNTEHILSAKLFDSSATGVDYYA